MKPAPDLHLNKIISRSRGTFILVSRGNLENWDNGCSLILFFSDNTDLQFLIFTGREFHTLIQDGKVDLRKECEQPRGIEWDVVLRSPGRVFCLAKESNSFLLEWLLILLSTLYVYRDMCSLRLWSSVFQKRLSRTLEVFEPLVAPVIRAAW